MTLHICIFALFICCSCSQPAPPAQTQPAAPASPQPPKWGMVIHTGAGNFTLAGIAERNDEMRARQRDDVVQHDWHGPRVRRRGRKANDHVHSR